VMGARTGAMIIAIVFALGWRWLEICTPCFQMAGWKSVVTDPACPPISAGANAAYKAMLLCWPFILLFLSTLRIMPAAVLD
jgi:hypothetical protein